MAVLREEERSSRRKEQSRELLGRGTVKLFALSLDLGGKGGREARPQAPLYARHVLLRLLFCSKPSSKASNLPTNSSCSFCFISILMARR